MTVGPKQSWTYIYKGFISDNSIKSKKSQSAFPRPHFLDLEKAQSRLQTDKAWYEKDNPNTKTYVNDGKEFKNVVLSPTNFLSILILYIHVYVNKSED